MYYEVLAYEISCSSPLGASQASVGINATAVFPIITTFHHSVVDLALASKPEVKTTIQLARQTPEFVGAKRMQKDKIVTGKSLSGV